MPIQSAIRFGTIHNWRPHSRGSWKSGCKGNPVNFESRGWKVNKGIGRSAVSDLILVPMPHFPTLPYSSSLPITIRIGSPLPSQHNMRETALKTCGYHVWLHIPQQLDCGFQRLTNQFSFPSLIYRQKKLTRSSSVTPYHVEMIHWPAWFRRR